MKKSELIEHFGSESELARFLGVTRVAINKLPENLSKSYKQRVIGAMTVANKSIPSSWIQDAA